MTEVCSKVSEELARRASLKKQQEELIQNKENKLEHANFFIKKLKTIKNEVVKCAGEKEVQYKEFCLSLISQSTETTQTSVL